MVEFLNRATVDIQSTEGRTLSGMAMPWDKVSMVRDLIRGRVTPPYPEAFAPVSTDKTRAIHPNFPVFVGHDPSSEPIGIVNFRRSDAEGGLMFDAPLSKTRRADDQLELANDGAMRSVSIQFRPVAAISRMLGSTPGVTYRTEVGLRHLALAPTGYGQYDDARVTAIRSDLGELDDTVAGAVQAADAAIDAAACCLDPTDPAYNIGQAQALITAAQLAVDAALAMLGAVDADDAEAESPLAAAMSGRMEAVYSTIARRHLVDRRPTFDLDRASGIGQPVVKHDVPLTCKVEVLQVTGTTDADAKAKAIAKVKSALAAMGGIHLISAN